MQIGVVFPQTEIAEDAGAIRTYGREVERMGFTHVLAYDHVLGANTASRPHWQGPYTLETPFYEPFVLFSYLAGATERLAFVSGVFILTQRQTTLVAKQAATLDVLVNGRLRLGIGTGWNEVEYEALGMPFADRGQRIEEQVEVMRALWTSPAVTFKGRQHTITDAGIKPLPVQRPIPIWFGGGSDRPHFGQKARDPIIRRIARIADGWIPQWQPDDRGRELLEKFRGYCREAGRDPARIGLEGRVNADRADAPRWAQQVAAWRDIGATHLSINTMGYGLHGVDQHLRRLEEFRAALPA
ncbi:MAG: LLM class F420-dependent oxidoreductase [Gammaproteobacteria bacterium]